MDFLSDNKGERTTISPARFVQLEDSLIMVPIRKWMYILELNLNLNQNL